MELTDELIKLFDKIKNDLESKGATVDTLEAEVIDDKVHYSIIANWSNGEVWKIERIEIIN